MPDWREFVRERLGPLGLRAGREMEIVTELADHIEDGGEAELAFHRESAWAAGPVDDVDWELLNREIRHAEEEMNERTRNLWLPGMAALLLSSLLLNAVIWADWQPSIFFLDAPNSVPREIKLPLVLYAPWLVMLPLLGAIGAWWSRRAGGNARSRLIAGLFPCVGMLALFLFGFTAALFIDRHVTMALRFSGLGLYIFGWVVLPGFLLAIGTLPFLRNSTGKHA